MNRHRKLNNHCIDCDKEIDDRSTRCLTCLGVSKKLSGSHKRRTDNHCSDCNKQITDNSIFCLPCANKYKIKVNSKQHLEKLSYRRLDFKIDYMEWIKNIFEKDEYKCQHCDSNKKLRAHHIYSYIKYPELRLNINNGITLCEYHHKQLHQLFGQNVSPKQLKWFFANVK